MSKERKKQQKKLRKAKKRRARARNRTRRDPWSTPTPASAMLLSAAMQKTMNELNEKERQREEFIQKMQQDLMQEITDAT